MTTHILRRVNNTACTWVIARCKYVISRDTLSLSSRLSDWHNIHSKTPCRKAVMTTPCGYVLVRSKAFHIMLYVFFWVIPRRLNFICLRFGTLCLFHLHRQGHLPAYGDGTECSEMSAYKIQTPGNYPEENIQHTEHGESLKSGTFHTNYIYA